MIFAKGKRGTTGIIFKWIFGFIAGALILAFLIKFTYVQMFQEEKLEESKLAVYLDDQLDAFGIMESSSKKIEWKSGSPIVFNCNQIMSGKYSRKTDKIIFSPVKLEGEMFNTWTKKWRFPYGVTNFYYLSNPKSRTLLVYYPETFDYVTNLKIPQIFNLQITGNQFFDSNLFATQAKGLDRFTIVFFGKSPEDASGLVNKLSKWTTAEVIEVDVDDKTADIYSKSGHEDVFYLGDEMLFGLIFSGSNFDCVKSLARERLRMLSKIYLNKIERVIGKTHEMECENMLYLARSTIETYNTLEDKDALYDYMKKIGNLNKKLEKNGCPTIY